VTSNVVARRVAPAPRFHSLWADLEPGALKVLRDVYEGQY
jgi:hypothetical protein